MPEILHMPKPSLGHRTIHKSSYVSCRHVVVYDGRLLFHRVIVGKSCRERLHGLALCQGNPRAVRRSRSSRLRRDVEPRLRTLRGDGQRCEARESQSSPLPWQKLSSFGRSCSRLRSMCRSHLADAWFSSRIALLLRPSANSTVRSSVRAATIPAQRKPQRQPMRLSWLGLSNLKGTATLDEFVAGLPSLEGQGFRAALQALKKGAPRGGVRPP